MPLLVRDWKQDLRDPQAPNAWAACTWKWASLRICPAPTWLSAIAGTYRPALPILAAS